MNNHVVDKMLNKFIRQKSNLKYQVVNRFGFVRLDRFLKQIVQKYMVLFKKEFPLNQDVKIHKKIIKKSHTSLLGAMQSKLE